MTLDNMTGITKGSYTGFCKRQLITCHFVKACNGVCPFEDALKHADKEMDEQTVIDHDKDWIIGCIEHDGFIHTHRFDKANQIILEALQEWIPCSERLPGANEVVLLCGKYNMFCGYQNTKGEWYSITGDGWETDMDFPDSNKGDILAWMPLPKPYKGGAE